MFDGSSLGSRDDITDSHRIAGGRSKKPLLLIGGGVGAIALIAILVMAMRGKDDPKTADKPKQPDQIVAVATPDSAETPPVDDPPVTPPVDDPPVTPPVDDPVTPPVKNPTTNPPTNPPVSNPKNPKNPKNPRIGKNPKNPPIETGNGSGSGTPVNTGGGDDDKNAKARAAYSTGNSKLFAGDAEGAIQAYRQVIAMGSSTGYRGLGLAYAQQGDTQNAIAAFKKYIAMSPNAKDVALIKKRIVALGGK